MGFEKITENEGVPSDNYESLVRYTLTIQWIVSVAVDVVRTGRLVIERSDRMLIKYVYLPNQKIEQKKEKNKLNFVR